MRGEGISGLALLASALVLALGIAFGGWIVASGNVEARLVSQPVDITAKAEQIVKADLGLWGLTLQAEGNNLADAQRLLDQQNAMLRNFLEAAGFDAAEMFLATVVIDDRNLSNTLPAGRPAPRFHLSQTTELRTSNVDLLTATALNSGALVANIPGLRSLDGPFYTIRDQRALEETLRNAAISNLSEEAEAISSQLGVRFDRLEGLTLGALSLSPATAGLEADASRSLFKRAQYTASASYNLEN
jgi:uncharacterized protein